ncbi:MAG: cadherin-like domain-containing protein [Myxococcales bacterium]|nr:cadherin-like domain-containing protein [Myxococcales bacterium]
MNAAPAVAPDTLVALEHTALTPADHAAELTTSTSTATRPRSPRWPPPDRHRRHRRRSGPLHAAGELPGRRGLRLHGVGRPATGTGTVTVNVTAVERSPVAGDDAATTVEDTALPLTAASLLANDTDPEWRGAVAHRGRPNAWQRRRARRHDGHVHAGRRLQRQRELRVHRPRRRRRRHATVTVTITSAPDAPVAVDDAITATEDQPSTLIAATLAANDTDADGDALTVTAVGAPSGGAGGAGRRLDPPSPAGARPHRHRRLRLHTGPTAPAPTSATSRSRWARSPTPGRRRRHRHGRRGHAAGHHRRR